MRSGTSTLYRFLDTHPDIFMSPVKEPGSLAYDTVLAESGRKDYARYFKMARGESHRGEASTCYSKRPDYDACAENAFRVLGANTRIIYLVREPVSRIRSQYEHERNEGLTGLSFDDAVKRFPRYINYSRHYYQSQPWLELFGPENVLFLSFHHMKAEPQKFAAALLEFLGLTVPFPNRLAEIHANRSAGSKKLPGAVRTHILSRSQYQTIKPFVPKVLRRGARALLARETRSWRPEINSETVDYIYQSLYDDLNQFRTVSGIDLLTSHPS
jgi:hypothetical protein